VLSRVSAARRRSQNVTLALACGTALALLSERTVAVGQQQPVFRASTTAVPLLVAVTNRGGDPVTDLGADDFEVFDNDQRADLVAFERQVAPAALRVLVSQTPRMRKDAARVRELAYALIEQAQPAEPVGIAVGYHPIQNGYGSFSSRKEELRADFEAAFQPVAIEGVLWWLSVLKASDVLNSRPAAVSPNTLWLRPGAAVWPSGQLPNVRAVVVVTPGMEQADRPSSDDYARQTLLHGTIVYGFAFGGRSRDKRLVRIAPQTSGWVVEPDKQTNLPAEVARIWTDLRNRYLLGFVPTVFDGKEHMLSVMVKRPDVIVRARTAYLAPKPQ
jgi:VWFA-related protein